MSVTNSACLHQSESSPASSDETCQTNTYAEGRIKFKGVGGTLGTLLKWRSKRRRDLMQFALVSIRPLSDSSLNNSVTQKAYLECGFVEIEQVATLKGVTGRTLAAQPNFYCGGLKRPLHGLECISRADTFPFSGQAQLLLEMEIEGLTAQQWGDVEGSVTQWLGIASPEDLDRAADSLNQWADSLLALKTQAI